MAHRSDGWIAETIIRPAAANGKTTGKPITLVGIPFDSQEDARKFVRWIHDHEVELRRNAGLPPANPD